MKEPGGRRQDKGARKMKTERKRQEKGFKMKGARKK